MLAEPVLRGKRNEERKRKGPFAVGTAKGVLKSYTLVCASDHMTLTLLLATMSSTASSSSTKRLCESSLASPTPILQHASDPDLTNRLRNIGSGVRKRVHTLCIIQGHI